MSKQHKWIAVVYDGIDKIGSRFYWGDDEEEVRLIALEWVNSSFGEGTDWSLHKMSEMPNDK